MPSDNVLHFARVSPATDRLHLRSQPLEVLSVGRNPELLRLRERAIAGRSDLTVRSLTPEEAEGRARSSTPYVWVFCSSIELSRIVYLACSIRRFCPSSRLLLLQGARPAGFEQSLFHRVLPPLHSPEQLLEAVSHSAIVAS